MAAPVGLGDRGCRLWVSLEAQDSSLVEEDNPLREIALEACRVADLLERFDDACADAPLTLTTDKGAVVNNPLFAERRQQQQSMKQLVVALRLPDEATGKKPQRRGARGAYKASGASAKNRLRAV